MVTLSVMSNSPLVSVIVSPLSLEEKSMVSPLAAAMMAAHSDPLPLSLLFVTVSVLSNVRSSIKSTAGTCRLRKAPARRRDGIPFRNIAIEPFGRLSRRCNIELSWC